MREEVARIGGRLSALQAADGAGTSTLAIDQQAAQVVVKIHMAKRDAAPILFSPEVQELVVMLGDPDHRDCRSSA